jgi:uroporphyrinogen-III synthase
VPLDCIDAPAAGAGQFDSEALWAVVSTQVVPGHRLLCVRGVSANGHLGRDWLSRQCEAGGGRCDSVVAYSRRLPAWSESEQTRVRQWVCADNSSPVFWLFSSSEALGHLRALCPGVSWAGASALVTHPRIEQAAQAAGFGRVFLCRPALPDVLARLESLQ